MRARVPVVIVSFLLAATACSGGDTPGDGPVVDPSETAAAEDVATEDGVPAMPAAVIDRVLADDASALVAGPGDEQYTLAGVASGHSGVVVVGTHQDEDDSQRRALLLHSVDGREWEDLSGSPALTGATLSSAVAVDDGLFVVGDDDASGPAMWPLTDGDPGEPLPVAYPDGPGRRIVDSALAFGGHVVVAGILLDVPDQPADADPPTMSVVLSVSADAGLTWTPLSVPDELSLIETDIAVIESMAAGHSPMELTMTEHAGEVVLATGVPGPGGTVTTLWRVNVDDESWTELGTTEEVLDGGQLDLLHTHGDALMAFTRADGDVAVWSSTDGGAAFERVNTGSSVFGGGGRQTVSGAASTQDGVLLVAGQNTGGTTGPQTTAELELWMTRDLETWERALDDPALASGGAVLPVGVVARDQQFVVVGTHERAPTGEESEAFNEAVNEGPVSRPSLARDAAVWIVGVEDRPVADPAATVRALDVSGFSGEVTISGLAPGGDGLVAAGWIRNGDDTAAAVWTSGDGESWERITTPAIDDSAGQFIYGLERIGDGLVAVGQAMIGDTRTLGVWTSPDGYDWTRSELDGAEFESAVGYGLAQTDAGLLAVGISDSGDEERYLSVGVWLSADGGESWSAIETADAPFGEHNAEFLADVAVAGDGRIVAAGHIGDAEARDGGGFSYTPQAYVVESADGQTWTRMADPFDSPWSDLSGVTAVGDDVIVLGSAGASSGGLPGEPPLAGTGVAVLAGDGWASEERTFRHTPRIEDAVESPFGTVAVGSWSRRGGGEDVLIAVLGDDGPEFITEGLLADGDQEAAAAVLFEDQVLVLGTETIDDETVVTGWSVTR
ncbi:exo-alpha-sialidase [Phytoactinopolyspora alkaliphila]|uniref:Exo-alpha-sialidase n=1 Tax=Phytoactinopolyspora alkaliphila TaxID=1783498 RepID=A0A6N9YSV5_9ACTN|nr:sialidase family protein [Phytoactinopolyspora alkaliphila]NED98054.1 exo-alpha-sialidase [Phytoactinopolyspora alkaliphila]